MGYKLIIFLLVSCLCIGECYAYFDPDLEKIRNEAQAGNPLSQAQLGESYARGEWGVNTDYDEALKWFRLAEKKDHPLAIYGLGRLYSRGFGVDQDIEKGREYYRKSFQGLEAGAPESTDPRWWTNLGFLYSSGHGGEFSEAKAFRWFFKAAEALYPRAMLSLGDMYHAGLGVESDLYRARYWYSRAMIYGNPEAKLKLARIWGQEFFFAASFSIIIFLSFFIISAFNHQKRQDLLSFNIDWKIVMLVSIHAIAGILVYLVVASKFIIPLEGERFLAFGSAIILGAISAYISGYNEIGHSFFSGILCCMVSWFLIPFQIDYAGILVFLHTIYFVCGGCAVKGIKNQYQTCHENERITLPRVIKTPFPGSKRALYFSGSMVLFSGLVSAVLFFVQSVRYPEFLIILGVMALFAGFFHSRDLAEIRSRRTRHETILILPLGVSSVIFIALIIFQIFKVTPLYFVAPVFLFYLTKCFAIRSIERGKHVLIYNHPEGIDYVEKPGGEFVPVSRFRTTSIIEFDKEAGFEEYEENIGSIFLKVSVCFAVLIFTGFIGLKLYIDSGICARFHFWCAMQDRMFLLFSIYFILFEAGLLFFAQVLKIAASQHARKSSIREFHNQVTNCKIHFYLEDDEHAIACVDCNYTGEGYYSMLLDNFIHMNLAAIALVSFVSAIFLNALGSFWLENYLFFSMLGFPVICWGILHWMEFGKFFSTLLSALLPFLLVYMLNFTDPDFLRLIAGPAGIYVIGGIYLFIGGALLWKHLGVKTALLLTNKGLRVVKVQFEKVIGLTGLIVPQKLVLENGSFSSAWTIEGAERRIKCHPHGKDWEKFRDLCADAGFEMEIQGSGERNGFFQELTALGLNLFIPFVLLLVLFFQAYPVADIGIQLVKTCGRIYLPLSSLSPDAMPVLEEESRKVLQRWPSDVAYKALLWISLQGQNRFDEAQHIFRYISFEKSRTWVPALWKGMSRDLFDAIEKIQLNTDKLMNIPVSSGWELKGEGNSIFRRAVGVSTGYADFYSIIPRIYFNGVYLCMKAMESDPLAVGPRILAGWLLFRHPYLSMYQLLAKDIRDVQKFVVNDLLSKEIEPVSPDSMMDLLDMYDQSMEKLAPMIKPLDNYRQWRGYWVMISNSLPVAFRDLLLGSLRKQHSTGRIDPAWKKVFSRISGKRFLSPGAKPYDRKTGKLAGIGLFVFSPPVMLYDVTRAWPELLDMNQDKDRVEWNAVYSMTSEKEWDDFFRRFDHSAR